MSKKQKKTLKRLIISLVLFLTLLILDRIFDLASLTILSWGLPFILYFSLYIYVGKKILKKAFNNIIHGQLLDENFLMSVATIGAFALGIYTGIKGEKLEGFDEGVGVILFYEIGEFFQSLALAKSRKSISDLMNIRPDVANLIVNQKEMVVSPSTVNVNDIILVKPGEKIPLDGIIIEGNSELDVKALTGESMPKDVSINDEVLSGSINITSDIKIKVTKPYLQSTVSKILELVENASSRKSKAEAFISKFARVYTPIVVFSAILLFIIPSLISKNWDTWLYRSLCFLVVSCPCALVISIPLTFFGGIGSLSSKGILVKGSNYLEAINKANIFIFDKTGTITKGNFKVTKIYPANKKDEILNIACICEAHSSHPIAKSILKEANYKNDNNNYSLKNELGKGIIASNEKDTLLVGNDKLLDSFNINYEKAAEVGTIIYVCKNDSYLGYIVIEDEIKESSIKAINELTNKGNKTYMFTGDNEVVAKNVASKLNISGYKSNLLPINKVEELDNIINNKKIDDVVCFIGDGINDAPSLIRSDIGIAMGGVGSDSAIEASDFVFMEDDLNGIIVSKKIAKKTITICNENIIFAIGVKVIILILSAIGLSSMWLSIVGDVGVALLAILNALRINTKNKNNE